MQYNVVKNTVHDELVKNFNVIQTTDTSDLVKRVAYYKKNEKVENKIPGHDKYITNWRI